MHEAFVTLNGVKTKISTWGHWIEESPEEISDIVVIIPGNPGVNGFYNKFAETVHKKLGYPVWCVGHAGHTAPLSDHDALPSLEGNEDLYGLKAQIKHKIDFFEKYIPPNARVHLVGHSIGSYITLETIEHSSIKDKLENAFLLFPAIERMAETGNGRFLYKTLRPFLGIICYLAWFVSVLPNFISTILFYIGLFINGIPIDLHMKNVKDLVQYEILQKVFLLAIEEMEQVKERNNGVIERNKKKLKFMYGAKDGWTSPNFCDKLKDDFPDICVENTNFNHAFVFKESSQVANVVVNWIKSRK